MKLGLLLLCLVAVVSCGRKSGNTTRVGSAGLGTGMTIGGTVRVFPSCGSGPADVRLLDSERYQLKSQAVYNNSSFSFQTAPGTYHLYASAGGCSVGTTPNQAITYSMTSIPICLANPASQCTSGYLKAVEAPRALKVGQPGVQTFCDWKDWGCSGEGTPGTGQSLFESDIRTVSKKETSFAYELAFNEGNDWVFVSPAFENRAWTLTARTDGKVKVGEVAYDSLILQTQIDRALLQFSAGFCGSAAEINTKALDYAEALGFTAESRELLGKRLTQQTKGFTTPLCAYPQDQSQIGKAIEAKSTKPVESRRLWFLLVPQLSTADLKKIDGPGFSAPATDALVAVKSGSKSRGIATAAELLVEELGAGYLVQK